MLGGLVLIISSDVKLQNKSTVSIDMNKFTYNSGLGWTLDNFIK